MRKLMAVLLVTIAAAALGAAGSLAAPNPRGTGKPGQSCQEIVANRGRTPGQAASSPGSPFNEPTETNPGGVGGQHYSESSQYDVACFQVSSR